MSKKTILIPVVLSLACLLALADFAQAQRHGGYRGGGGNGWGNGWGSNNWYGNNWGLSIGVGPAYGYYGNGYGSGYYPGGAYGWSRGGYYSYPSTIYYDVAPNYNTTPSTQFYYDPAPATTNTAQVRVLVPDPNARVWFDGNLTQQTGTDRVFLTPPLQAGAANTYRIRASWMQNGREITQERVVNVTPNRMAMVDFNQPQSEPVPIGQQPPPTPPAPLPAGERLEGRILRIATDQFVIETRDNRQVTVYTNPETRFLMNENPAAFTDLRSGINVSLSLRRQGDRHFATMVTIRP